MFNDLKTSIFLFQICFMNEMKDSKEKKFKLKLFNIFMRFFKETHFVINYFVIINKIVFDFKQNSITTNIQKII